MILAGCVEPSNTGIEHAALMAMATAGGIMALGFALHAASRAGGRIRPFAAALLLLLALVLSVGFVRVQGAPAAAAGCEKFSVPATITQTSTLDGLAAGVASHRIAGVITNTGTRALRIDSITVSISRVTKAPAAAAGSCSARDYLLTVNRMRVRATIAPGASAKFTGASLGFANSTQNQDACKNATVSLRYVAYGKRGPAKPNPCGRDSASPPKRWMSQQQLLGIFPCQI